MGSWLGRTGSVIGRVPTPAGVPTNWRDVGVALVTGALIGGFVLWAEQSREDERAAFAQQLEDDRAAQTQQLEDDRTLRAEMLENTRFTRQLAIDQAETKPLAGLYLSGASLGGLDLSGADLRGADLSGADLRETDLTGADLSEADLSGANMIWAELVGARLNHGRPIWGDLGLGQSRKCRAGWS